MALIALRFVIGWHFFAEGRAKLRDPKPFTAGFFGAAKGPLAPYFHNLAWDVDGRIRLDRELTWNTWDAFRQQAARHYGFSEEQSKQAEAIAQAYLRELDTILVDDKEEIDTYFKGLARRDANREDPTRREVPSLKGQAEKISSELNRTRGAWLGRIDKLWVSLETDLNRVATAEQRARGGVGLAKPQRAWIDAQRLDAVVPYFDLTIGICLILGFFTRTAAVAAAGFLTMVVATQPPWIADSAPTYYQMVELVALLVVACFGAGQHAGIDAVLCAGRQTCCSPKTGTQSNENANRGRT